VNGPEHYRRAEELLADITRDDGSVDFGDGGEAFAAAAQVHATLAAAAASAMATVSQHIADSYQPDDWAEAIGWTRYGGLTPADEADEMAAAAGDHDEPPY